MTRARFIWSIHKTRDKAEQSLEQDLAAGDVSWSEFAAIEKRGNVWLVMLWEIQP